MMVWQNEKQDEQVKNGSTRTEYSVYTILKVNGSNDNMPRWEKKHTTTDLHKALARAKVYHRSNNYARVEVKKKICNEQDMCQVIEAYRIFENSAQADAERRCLIVATVLAVSLAAAFTFTHLL